MGRHRTRGAKEAGQRSVLERNLRLLPRKVAAAIRAADFAGLHGEVQEIKGRNGVRTLSCGGIQLASAYDPVAEGSRIADEMARDPADLVLAMGLALGHHLEAYRNLNRCPLLIYEPSLARLRAALAIRPLPFLAEPDVELVTDLGAISRWMTRTYRSGLCLRVALHPSVMRLEPDAVRELLDQVKHSKSSADVGTRTRVRAMATWSWLTVSNARRITHSVPFSKLDGVARGAPAVVVIAGPSLDKQLGLLKQYRDRVVVICIGQALGSLRRAGIEPDLVHVIESKAVLHQLDRAGSTRDLNLVLSPDSHPELFAAPVHSRFVATPLLHLVAKWVATQLGSHSCVMGGATVAQGSIGLAVALGADPVILIGQDLAFTHGRVYAAGSAYGAVELETRLREDGTEIFVKRDRLQRELLGDKGGEDLERTSIFVRGWHGDRVLTSRTYASFIEGYRDVATYARSCGVKLLNCTEGGAALPDVEQRSFADVLREFTGDPVNVQEPIERAHQAWVPPGSEVFAPGIAAARRHLVAVERQSRRGIVAAERAGRAMPGARSPAHVMELLRGVGRVEGKLITQLRALPWLSAMMQGEIHQSVVQQRTANNAKPTPEQAIEEALVLFRGTLAGVSRARKLMSELERVLAEDSNLAMPVSSQRHGVPASVI